MANPAPTINQINAFNATQGTIIDFNIIGGTELVRSNKIYIYDLSDNSLICTHLYVSTESIHELPANTDGSIVYESGKSSADFVNGAQYYAQIQTFTDIAGTQGGSGLSVSKLFWCLVDPSLTIDTIPSSISTTSYNVSATYDANTSVVSNIIQQYQFSLYSATGSLLQSSGVVVGNGEQQGTSTAYDISYNFSGLSVGSSYYVVVDVTTTQGMSISAQSNTFTVSIDTPTLGEATVVNNACDGYISVTSNLSGEYGGSASGEIATFETDSVNNVTKLEVTLEPIQEGTGDPSPSNVRPITGHDSITVYNTGVNIWDEEWEVGSLNGSTGANTGATTDIVSKNYIPVKPSTSYYIKSTITKILVCQYDVNKNFISAIIWGDPNKVATLSSACYYLKLATYGGSGATYNNDISINYPSTDHDYHAYDGQTITQDFNVTLTPTVIDETPYLFKATGDIRGDRESLELVGGTVNWNQLVHSLQPSACTVSESGGVITVTPSSGNRLIAADRLTNSHAVKDGHKYLNVVWIKSDGTHDVGFQNYLVEGTKKTNSSSWIELSGVFKCEGSANGVFQLYSSSNTEYQIKKNSYLITDLTAFFGNSATADYVYSLETANAGAGVAWLRKYFPDLFAYSPYNTGTLESVKPTAHVTRGVNQWDEELENNWINNDTGQPQTNSDYLRTKNFISILPSTEYYYKAPQATQYARLYFYDADKNFISYAGTSNYLNSVFTTPSNAYYMKFVLTKGSYGTTYKNDITVNISDPAINGKYFPAEHHVYPITELELRGMPKLVDGELRFDGDTRKADGTVTRKRGYINLGSLDYVYASSLDRFYSDVVTNAETVTTDNNAADIVVGGEYTTYPVNDIEINKTDKSVGMSTNKRVYIRNTAVGTNPSSLKTSLDGVYMLYPLATPTTETADPFADPQEVSIYGTEEFISSNGVPVGNKTTYKTRDIFGGTIDLVSGVLTVTKKGVNLADYNWGYNNGLFTTKEITDFPRSASGWAGVTNFLCEKYAYSNWDVVDSPSTHDKQMCMRYVNGAYWVRIADSSYNNADAFKKSLDGTMLVYPLETPLTYQLTPQQIETLIGTNNVWSNAGDVLIEFNIPITNLLVKRQDVDDVSGNWLTLYSQLVEQASDMDFTFIDFLNQYGKTYKYALVPLLTQTQSGVEVEVEGGYTVSDEVQSIFDGVYIGDATGVQRLKAGVAYNNLNTNQQVGVIPTLGNKYPIIVSNGNIQYDTGSVSGLIVPDDFYSDGNLSRIDMSDKRGVINDFLTNKKPKILKDWNGNIWLVVFTDNVDVSFDNNYGMGVATFTSGWTEVGDPTNQEDLQRTGLINVGGD